MKKNALVVSGGGSKGAFAVGAIDYIVNKLGVEFSFVSGTSTGGLISPLIVTNEVQELVRIYSTVTTPDIVKRRELADALRANSLYDVSPLNELIRKELTPERGQAIMNSNKQMVLTTVCLQTGKIAFFQSGPSIVARQDSTIYAIQTLEELRRAVLASANIPAMMPPVVIPPGADPLRQYVDGGVKEYAPIRIAIDNGATHIYVILLSPERRETDERRFQGIANILIRTISLLAEDVGDNDLQTAKLYNDALQYMAALRDKIGLRFNLNETELDSLFTIPNQRNPFGGKRIVELKIVRPEHDLPIDTLEFDPRKMTEIMQQGRDRAKLLLT